MTQVNLSTKYSWTQRTDLVVDKGGGRDRRGIHWEFGISRCKLLYREWMNNKVLLYSIGNYIQYPVINHNRKAYEKGCTYVCVYIYIHMYIYN